MVEKRKSERVQFFNGSAEIGIRPVWVFRRTRPDSLLGLMVDISDNGVQIITHKDASPVGDVFQLMVFGDGDEDSRLTAFVQRKWSREEGTLYARHGFAFEEEAETLDAIRPIIDAGAAREKWLRCELIDVGARD